ncbi:hypothetical protein [Streptomyces sp. HNM0574]|uniref:hypothetical protein n=1 Tax=Streptomyces sp. HNM0574 TaxID=2714954 RepID=UPI00146A18F9|nr:hypothetical protein [Streptomyces sp. HNM0574]NLU69395.1 hypothetical protein [Streptomyces sp. HNM0574]
MPRTPFPLVPSEDLPHGWAAPAVTAQARSLARELLALSDRSGARRAAAAARRLRQECADAASLPYGEDARASRGNLDNDRFFGVLRVRGDARTVLLGSTAQAYAELLDELAAAGSALERSTLDELGRGLGELVAAVTGEPSSVLPTPRGVSCPRAATDRPLRRWRRGHHLFLVLLQGLAVTTGGLTSALDGPRTGSDRTGTDRARRPVRGYEARGWARLITLLRASSAALSFTGDFAGLDYRTHVRPLMSDPVVPGGMTGLDLRDHACLLDRLRDLGTALVRNPPPDEESARRPALLCEVLTEVYEDHGRVCARFVGEDRTSLIADSGPPAVTALRRMATARLHLLPGPHHDGPAGAGPGERTRPAADGPDDGDAGPEQAR